MGERMKKRRMAMGVILAALIVGLGWEVVREREPVYQGKPLSFWMECLTNPPGNGPLRDNWNSHYGGWQNSRWSFTKQKELGKAMAEIGTNAVPFLRKMVRYRDTPLKLKLERIAERQSLIRFDFHSEAEMHYKAAAACLEANSAVRDQLVRDWIQYWEDEGGESQADSEAYDRSFVASLCFLTALNRGLGPTSVEPLTRAWTNATDARVRRMTAAALHQLPAPLIVPILLSNLENPSAEYRSQSILQLWYFTNAAPIITPALMRKLDDKDGNVRSEATNALRRIAPEAAAKVLAGRKTE
jgi:hypothetical protein